MYNLTKEEQDVLQNTLQGRTKLIPKGQLVKRKTNETHNTKTRDNR